MTKNRSAIMRDNLSSVDEKTRAHLVSKGSIKRSIRRHQAADFSKAPSTLREIEEWPTALTEIGGKRWLVKDTCKNGRLFIFATQAGLRILGKFYFLLPLDSFFLKVVLDPRRSLNTIVSSI